MKLFKKKQITQDDLEDMSFVIDYPTTTASGLEGIAPNLVSSQDRQFDNNSIIMSCYNWASRNIIEPPIILCETLPDMQTRRYVMDPALEPFRMPNANSWTFPRLMQAIMLSLMFYGNAYVLMRQGRDGQIELHWLEPWAVTVTGSLYPETYQYSSGVGIPKTYTSDNIIHIAQGIDTKNRLLGMSPLRGVLKWALTDNEAALYTLAIMKQQGKRTMMLTPTKEKGRFSKSSMEKLTSLFQGLMTGHKAGTIIAMDAGVDIKEVGMSPEESALDKMLRVPERKITSALGIHMIILGLMDDPSYSNFQVAERVVTEDFLIPTWLLIADAFTKSLYPKTSTYRKRPSAYYQFDLSKVRSLQEDEDKRHLRHAKDYYYGIIKRSEARIALGLDVSPEDDVYYHDVAKNMTQNDPSRREGVPLEDTVDDRKPR